MRDINEMSLEEVYFVDEFTIGCYLSSNDNKLWTNFNKYFKKVVNNDSREAFKINARVNKARLLGRALSQEEHAAMDEILDHPERRSTHSSFFNNIKVLKLYPNASFVQWNKHIEIYDSLEKSHFSRENAIEMYIFLNRIFFTDEHDKTLNLDLLMQRDFNILLILLHLDALIFKDKFKNISLYKYLAIGKVKGVRKPTGHMLWNLIKVIAYIELNNKNFNIELNDKQLKKPPNIPKKIPKDEDCFSLCEDMFVEKIKYAVRHVKTGKRIFYLSYFYLLIGAKKLYEDSRCFSGFSLTGLWFIYIYLILLVDRNKPDIHSYLYPSDSFSEPFQSKYQSKSEYEWPSDLSSY
jgi:hypothetical protein